MRSTCEYFRDRLNNIMRSKRLYVSDLSRLSGVKASALYKLTSYGNDPLDPRLSTLVKLANALGVSLDWLAGRLPTTEGRNQT